MAHLHLDVAGYLSISAWQYTSQLAATSVLAALVLTMFSSCPSARREPKSQHGVVWMHTACGALLRPTVIKCEPHSRQVSAVRAVMHATHQVCEKVYVVCRQSRLSS